MNECFEIMLESIRTSYLREEGTLELQLLSGLKILITVEDKAALLMANQLAAQCRGKSAKLSITAVEVCLTDAPSPAEEYPVVRTTSDVEAFEKDLSLEQIAQGKNHTE